MIPAPKDIEPWVCFWREFHLTLANEEATHFVYCLMRLHPGKPESADPVTIYIGYTNDPVRRLGEHAKTKWWWPAVDLSVSCLLGFQSKEEAIAAEAQFIFSECPEMNRAGRVGKLMSL